MKLTGGSTFTSLTNSGSINFNGYTITLADGTVLRRPRFQHIKTVSNVSFETVFYGYPQLSRYVSSAGLLSPTYQ